MVVPTIEDNDNGFSSFHLTRTNLRTNSDLLKPHLILQAVYS